MSEMEKLGLPKIMSRTRTLFASHCPETPFLYRYPIHTHNPPYNPLVWAYVVEIRTSHTKRDFRIILQITVIIVI